MILRVKITKTCEIKLKTRKSIKSGETQSNLLKSVKAYQVHEFAKEIRSLLTATPSPDFIAPDTPFSALTLSHSPKSQILRISSLSPNKLTSADFALDYCWFHSRLFTHQQHKYITRFACWILIFSVMFYYVEESHVFFSGCIQWCCLLLFFRDVTHLL